MPYNALVVFQTNTDQVIKVAIRKSLDIEKYRRALDLQLRITNDMYFSLTDGEGFQRVVILLGLAASRLRDDAGETYRRVG